MAGPQSEAPSLPGFTYSGWLGSGGFADVFSYNQDDLDREVAVKVLLDDLPGEAAKLFASEINLMAKLSSHPSIVSVFQAGMAGDGRPFLVMECCPPPTLRGRLRREPFDVAKTLEIGIQIASAVETAHRLGVVHRDIKPSNILFTEYGRAALTDFGISIPTASSPGAETAYSVAWAPPEQIRNQSVGPAADIYSLGASLWAMLAGHSPFESTTGENSYDAIQRRNLYDPVPPLGRGDVPESLERALLRALEKEPAKRQPSALDFARQLQQVQSELNLPRTTIDVRVDASARKKAAEAEMAYEGTRVASFAGGNAPTNAAEAGSASAPTNDRAPQTEPVMPQTNTSANGQAQFWLPVSQGAQPGWWNTPSYHTHRTGPPGGYPSATGRASPPGPLRPQPGPMPTQMPRPMVAPMAQPAPPPPPLVLNQEQAEGVNPFVRNMMIAIASFLVVVIFLVLLL